MSKLEYKNQNTIPFGQILEEIQYGKRFECFLGIPLPLLGPERGPPLSVMTVGVGFGVLTF